MISGILSIDKPSGPTSHDVLQKLRRILNTKKIGHAGTLDPFATGLLVALIGEATRLSQFISADEKGYVARLAWGKSTDTGDLTGRVEDSSDAPMPDPDQVRQVLKEFLGDYEQLPPMYSAKKVEGKTLYKEARKGNQVERKPVTVQIWELDLLETHLDGFSFFVRCGKGTYVRTLAEDIAKKLGGYAHLTQLRRTISGDFDIRGALTLKEVSSLYEKGELEQHIKTVDLVCERFPSVVVSAEAAAKMIHGRVPVSKDVIRSESFQSGDTVRIIDEDGVLLSLALATAGEKGTRRLGTPTPEFKLVNNFCARREAEKKMQ